MITTQAGSAPGRMGEHGEGTCKPRPWRDPGASAAQLLDESSATLNARPEQLARRLPTIMQLSQEHGVATATVVKALRILKRDGLVIGSSGHGTFVAERPGK